MSNWAENPRNKRQTLMGAALPHILFNECHRYCVDSEFEAASTAEQKTCLANCQDKTYKAFDMYLNVAERFAARKNFRSYVDISKFTGMEVEHKHDTESAIPHKYDGHIHPKSVEEFHKEVDRNFSDIQKKALN